MGMSGGQKKFRAISVWQGTRRLSSAHRRLGRGVLVLSFLRLRLAFCGTADVRGVRCARQETNNTDVLPIQIQKPIASRLQRYPLSVGTVDCLTGVGLWG
jgi:hypothetical protein